jgi:hypothetical protein
LLDDFIASFPPLLNGIAHGPGINGMTSDEASQPPNLTARGQDSECHQQAPATHHNAGASGSAEIGDGTKKDGADGNEPPIH